MVKCPILSYYGGGEVILLPDKVKEAKEKYSQEINSIRHRLQLLESGRIKDITGANMDGYLATNISKLRKELGELFVKMANNSDSANDELNDIFK